MLHDPKQIAKCYQPLFDYMLNEYSLILLVSEMDEIKRLSEQVKDNLNYLDEKMEKKSTTEKKSIGPFPGS